MRTYKFSHKGFTIMLGTNDDGSGLFLWEPRTSNWTQLRGTVEHFGNRAAVRKAYFTDGVRETLEYMARNPYLYPINCE